ncbi:MAG: Uroporphyrinogen decarboxylase (URO-D) [bacterium ADurb.Bin429]|nr:MAG: Uroporphyrinogen decarboxylase (URO-D) [bacterium ADurb.Bin429]
MSRLIDNSVIAANLTASDAFWHRREPGSHRVTVHYPLPEELIAFDVPAVTDAAVARALYPALDALRCGFHNLPLLRPFVPTGAGTHLIAWLLGGPVTVSGETRSNFTAWTVPLGTEEDVYHLRVPDLSVHPYGRALKAAIAAIPPAWQALYPVLISGVSPIDAAADLLGGTEFYCAFHAAPEALRYLLDCCTETTLALYDLQRTACANGRGPYGAPGIYVNDLVTQYLSYEHWRDFVLPCYRRLARAVGGIVLGANAPDPRVLPEVTAMEGFLGCTVHKAVPPETVIACLRGRGVYLLTSHPYDPRFDAPTLHRGVYYNPIVANPYVNYREIFTELAGEVALLVVIDRPGRDEALADAHELLAK